MHVQPISTFRLFQEGHLLRNSIAIFVLTTLFYFIGAELRLVHELSLFWPLNGVMAGVFARYVWLNRLHYYAISYVAMLVYDAITTEWGLVSLAINFSNMMFIVTVALLVARDKRLGKNKYEPVSALRLFNYCLLAALLCAIVGAIGSVSIDSLDFWPLLADWFSEQFSTGVLIVPCMLTLAIPGVLPRFKAEQMMPAIALIVSVIASVVIGGAGSLAFPLPALIWCAVRYTPQVTCLLTFVTGASDRVPVPVASCGYLLPQTGSLAKHCALQQSSPEMSRCPLSWQQANVGVEGRCCYLGHSQDRQCIRYSPAAPWQAAPPPDAIVQRQSADIKRGSSQTFFYSRQRVTPIVDKTDKFASRHHPIEQTFFTRPGH